MQRSRNIKKASSSSSTLKKVLYWIIGLIIIFPIIRFIIRQYQKFNSLEVEVNEKNEEVKQDKTFLENQNPIIQQSKADKITVRKDIQKSAKQLAHHLGTKYSDKNSMWSWLDPRGWTENDKQAANILIYQQKNYNLIKRVYNEVYTNSRNLSDDIYALLDETELKRVLNKVNIT